MLLRHAAWIVYDRRSASHGVGFIGRSHKLRGCGEPATGSRVGIATRRPLGAASSLAIFPKLPSSGLVWGLVPRTRREHTGHTGSPSHISDPTAKA